MHGQPQQRGRSARRDGRSRREPKTARVEPRPSFAGRRCGNAGGEPPSPECRSRLLLGQVRQSLLAQWGSLPSVRRCEGVCFSPAPAFAPPVVEPLVESARRNGHIDSRGVPSSPGLSAGPTAGFSLAVRLDRRVAAGRRREPCGQERGLEPSSVRLAHSLLHVQHRQLPEKQLSVPGSSGSSRMRTVSRLMLVQNRPGVS